MHELGWSASNNLCRLAEKIAPHFYTTYNFFEILSSMGFAGRREQLSQLLASILINWPSFRKQARCKWAAQAELYVATARIKSPLTRFRHWRWGGRFRRRRRRRYVPFDQVPKHCGEHQGDQLHAPVFQRQSGPQDGNQHRAPVLRGLSLHNFCAAKFPRCIDEAYPERKLRSIHRRWQMEIPLVSIESVAKKVPLHPENEIEMSEYGDWRMLCLWNVGRKYLSLSKPC